MMKYTFPAIVVILILICMITNLPAPEPDYCAICNSIPYHTPIQVLFLQIYKFLQSRTYFLFIRIPR